MAGSPLSEKMTGRNDPCWCGSGKKWKRCHKGEPPPKESSAARAKRYGILLKNEEQVAKIRQASIVASTILDELSTKATPGKTTKELDTLAKELHEKMGATAAAYKYGSPPWPAYICTSLNDVICHGIPNDIPLQEGDILNIDVASIVGGYFGDCSRMVIVGGETSKEKQLVVDVSYECLMRAIEAVRPEQPLSAIGEAISAYAEERGCSVVHDFVAHGVGVRFHEEPQIPHYRNRIQTPLIPGMTFTIEPMINAGSPDSKIDPSNGWEARTIDGKPSAQWEHTLLVTEEGVEVLTPWKR